MKKPALIALYLGSNELVFAFYAPKDVDPLSRKFPKEKSVPMPANLPQAFVYFNSKNRVLIQM